MKARDTILVILASLTFGSPLLAQQWFHRCEEAFAAASAAINAEEFLASQIVWELQFEGEAFCMALQPAAKQKLCKTEIENLSRHYKTQVLPRIEIARQHLEQARSDFQAMVNTANLLGLGNAAIPKIPPGDRVFLFLKGQSVRHHLGEAKRYLQLALVGEEQALPQIICLRPLIYADAVRLIALNGTSQTATIFACWCALPQCAEIVTKSVANIRVQLNGQGGGNGLLQTYNPVLERLNTHPSFEGQIETLDVSTADRSEFEGNVFRTISVGHEIPAGTIIQEDFIPFGSFTPLAYGNSPLCVISRQFDSLGDYKYNFGERRGESIGNPLHVAVKQFGEPPIAICGADGDVLEPGQFLACSFTLDVTGSPEQIANGDLASATFDVLALGGNRTENDGHTYMWVRITMQAPMEGPNDPCYIWNYETESYEVDRTNPDCLGTTGTGGDDGGGGPGFLTTPPKQRSGKSANRLRNRKSPLTRDQIKAAFYEKLGHILIRDEQ